MTGFRGVLVMLGDKLEPAKSSRLAYAGFYLFFQQGNQFTIVYL